MKLILRDKKGNRFLLALSNESGWRPAIGQMEQASAFDGRLSQWLGERCKVDERGRKVKTGVELVVERETSK